ncbi:MAG: amino acid adenylation domain-containing protein [Nostoc sp.]
MKLENLEDIYELSPMQQGMLFHSLSAPESGEYIELLSCVFKGNLDISAFKLAWQQVVERHPVWRTCFHWENLAKPIQVVKRQVNLPWEQHDWRELSTSQQQEQLEALLEAEQKRGFVLSQAPLMRLYLIELEKESYQFIWTHHHLLVDGWSVSLVFKEVFAFYQAFSRNQDLHLELSRPYRDYIAWLQEQDLASAETFWRQTLKDFTAPTPLGVDTVVPSRFNQTKTYEHQQLQLSTAMTAALSTLARQHQLTLNTIIQGAWALLLWRYSAQTDVVFGATVSGRPSTLLGVESMVGLFINTLPVRVQVSPETELISWLKQLQAQQVELRQYEYSPLVQVQGWSEVPRGLPLFESIIVFENYPVDASLEQHSSDIDIIDIRGIELTNYPLTLVVGPSRELFFRFSYDSRFEATTITRMLGHFQTMLEGMTMPQQRLMDLPLLTAAERQQLLVEWNNQKAYPDEKCIHQLFEAQVELTPNAVAVVCEDQMLTYSELNSRANCLAHCLRSLGVKQETLVGICTTRSLSMIVGILGILKAGGAYVPLDPAYPKDRLAWILEDSQISVLLTQQQQIAELPPHQAQVVCLDTDALVNFQNVTNPSVPITANNLAYAIYTSGSTGKPKGIAIAHYSAVTFLNWAIQLLPHKEFAGVLASTSICFDISIFELFAPLSCGGKVILVDNILHLPAIAASQQVTLINTVPAAMTELLQVNDVPTSVSTVCLGGEPVSNQLVQQLYQKNNIQQVFNLYGPTEDTVYSTFALVEKGATSSPAIGRPIANTQIYILDRYFQPVPVGVVGELYISGAGLARGYLRQPELTAQKFIPNPFLRGREQGAGGRGEEDQFSDFERLYKTGDLARYLHDGNIQFLGRSDRQIKIRGFRIELGEIEAVLGQHPAVRQTIVTDWQESGDRLTNSPNNPRIVAYVVFNQEEISTHELRGFLQEKLPNYMIPSHFVVLKTLPLTPNGKVNRRALPAPEIRPDLEIAYVMPQTKLEQTIATVWQKALNLEKVGIHDNFFELGGHSLLIIQIHSQLREVLQTDFPMLELLRYPTISSLVDYFSRIKNQSTSSQKTDTQSEKLKYGKARLKQRREQIQLKD